MGLLEKMNESGLIRAKGESTAGRASSGEDEGDGGDVKRRGGSKGEKEGCPDRARPAKRLRPTAHGRRSSCPASAALLLRPSIGCTHQPLSAQLQPRPLNSSPPPRPGSDRAVRHAARRPTPRPSQTGADAFPPSVLATSTPRHGRRAWHTALHAPPTCPARLPARAHHA